MANTRALILLSCVVFASANDLIVGHNWEGRVVIDEDFEASPALWRQTTSFCVNTSSLNETISAINVTDLRPQKNGEAKITDGGVGLQDVTIELKSPTVLRGYSFHIKVYAVPKIDGKAPPSLIGQDIPIVPLKTNLGTTIPQDTSSPATATSETVSTRITRDVTDGFTSPISSIDDPKTTTTVSMNSDASTSTTTESALRAANENSSDSTSTFSSTIGIDEVNVTPANSGPTLAATELNSRASRKARDIKDATMEATKTGDNQTTVPSVPSILGKQTTNAGEDMKTKGNASNAGLKSVNGSQTVAGLDKIPPLPYNLPTEGAKIQNSSEFRYTRDVSIPTEASLGQSGLEKFAENQTRKLTNPKLFAEEDDDDEEDDLSARTVKTVSNKCTTHECEMDFNGNDEPIIDPNLSHAS